MRSRKGGEAAYLTGLKKHQFKRLRSLFGLARAHLPRLTPLAPLAPVFKVDRACVFDEIVHGRLGRRLWRIGRHPEREVAPRPERQGKDDADWGDEHRETEEEEGVERDGGGDGEGDGEEEQGDRVRVHHKVHVPVLQ